MKSSYLFIFVLCFIFFSLSTTAQNLPHNLTNSEKLIYNDYILNSANRTAASAFTNPPSSPVRCMAEWEELQGLLITWTSFPSMLLEITREAKKECRVYIVTSNSSSVINTLNANGIDTTNITFLNTSFNSVWSRDYGPWSVYTNDVDSLLIIDWIYNRPRPQDDIVPVYVANEIGAPLYQTTQSPWNLIHTGGNFMTDGMGTGFSSKLILNENPGKTETDIDTIMNAFMGIDTYIKMDNLPYDVIHHIDMHMKLLDEETILMGEYPAGVADGPQIEANLLYVLNNFNSPFGTPYKVVRIPMPPSLNGQYPNTGSNYYTHANSVIINKTILVPIYNLPSDTTALRIFRENKPGYKVVGINSNPSIPSLGAIHCITKEIGTSDPLLIIHNDLEDTYDDANPYPLEATIKHRSGIAGATVWYRTDTVTPYQSITMTQSNPGNSIWSANIPAQNAGSTIYYYIEAFAFSGKIQVRPLPAPDGYFHFNVLTTTGIQDQQSTLELTWNKPAFPNPSHGITCIPISVSKDTNASLKLLDINGKLVEEIHKGMIKTGSHNFFIDTRSHSPGVYSIELRSKTGKIVQKHLIR